MQQKPLAKMRANYSMQQKTLDKMRINMKPCWHKFIIKNRLV